MKLPIAIFLSLTTATAVASQEPERNIIRISTDNTDLILDRKSTRLNSSH